MPFKIEINDTFKTPEEIAFALEHIASLIEQDYIFGDGPKWKLIEVKNFFEVSKNQIKIIKCFRNDKPVLVFKYKKQYVLQGDCFIYSTFDQINNDTDLLSINNFDIVSVDYPIKVKTQFLDYLNE